MRATKWLVDDFDAYNVKVSLQAIPAADVVEVVHALWIVEDGCAYCSYCRNNFKKAIMTHSKFCPMCGAKMDGKSADYAPAKPYDLLYEEGGPDA